MISVDTKKKENIGNFKNNGAEYRKTKNPRKVWDHDFPVASIAAWKCELQELADYTGLEIMVSHYPPGAFFSIVKLYFFH